MKVTEGRSMLQLHTPASFEYTRQAVCLWGACLTSFLGSVRTYHATRHAVRGDYQEDALLVEGHGLL